MIPAVASTRIATMTPDAIAKVRLLESVMLTEPQVEIDTAHVIHAGMYARTITIPAGVALTGAEIKRATLLILNGHATVYLGGESVELCGYHVIPASAGRKQAFVAHADTDLTMVFPSQAQTVEAAECEFTDEADLLMSRHGGNESIVITGE